MYPACGVIGPVSMFPAPLPQPRAGLLDKLARLDECDLLVIGGGATGLGTALDAAARGFKVVLVEAHDFAKGSSSRSTKLVYGGVRYLAQGSFYLVSEALRERRTLLDNAPHLARPLPFVMPVRCGFGLPLYGLGLKFYDFMAGRNSLGPTEVLGRTEITPLLPTVDTAELCGGVKYWDGQFDDARFALALARTAAIRGALLVNYCAARELLYEEGRVRGAVVEDVETGRILRVKARCVVNATGPWVDALCTQDGQHAGRAVRPIITPSQGVHIVVDRHFLPTDHALLLPKTADGRVLFALPWLGKIVLGTTDTLRLDLAYEPHPLGQEIDFILSEAAAHLRVRPTRADVRSIWVGLRPLVASPGETGEKEATKHISREHLVIGSESGLITVTGGKWTTYRVMAEDILTESFRRGLLPPVPGGVTTHLPLVGAPEPGTVEAAQCPSLTQPPGEHLYGTEAQALRQLPGADNWLAEGVSEAMVRFAARFEYARNVEDVLARRSRLLFVDARLAANIAPQVAGILAEELPGHDPGLAPFLALAQQYVLNE